MWLYYYLYALERMLRNMTNPTTLTNPTSEWPSRYHYFVESMMSNLRGWIISVRELPLDQANICLDHDDGNENGNIPLSSMTVYCACLKQLLASDSITDRFKRDSTNTAFDIYMLLLERDELAGYAQNYVDKLLAGGFTMNKAKRDYVEMLADYNAHWDNIPYLDGRADKLEKKISDHLASLPSTKPS